MYSSPWFGNVAQRASPSRADEKPQVYFVTSVTLGGFRVAQTCQLLNCWKPTSLAPEACVVKQTQITLEIYSIITLGSLIDCISIMDAFKP